MIWKVGAVLGAIAISATASWADVATNKALVQNMMKDVFAARDADAVDSYFAEDYIQRNPLIPSGSAPVKALLQQLAASDAPAAQPTELHRIIGEGDLVATHSTLFGFGPTPLVAFDIFRIEDGKIAEHWDNLIPLRAEPNPAGRTQVDGATEVADADQTDANKALVVELLEKVFIGGEAADITRYINPAKYLQHNPDAGDGLQGLQELMQRNAAQGQAMHYGEVGIVVAEGNFVLTGAAGTLGETPTAFYDLWRLEDGLIVEHWDVIAPIQTDNLPPGYPGKF